MANLQLAVKGEYFDAMIRGEKTEEYRLCNDYWNKRIMFREYDRLIITKDIRSATIPAAELTSRMKGMKSRQSHIRTSAINR